MNRAFMSQPVDGGFSRRYSFLTAWRLWRNLLHPHDPPLFRRTMRLPPDPTTIPHTYLIWLVLLFSTFACCGLIQLKSTVTILLPIALVAISSSYAVVWVIRVADTVHREHERGTYDQFSLVPAGSLGATWALAVAALHRGDALGWIDSIRKLITILLLIALLAILLTTALRQNHPTLAQFGPLLLDMLALAAASYIDHVHTIVLGSLIGMITATQSNSSVDARLSAALIFLSLQALTCLVTLLTPLVVVPMFSGIAALVNWTFPISPLMSSLLVFYGTREVLISLCWQTLARQLNANPAEFRFWD